MLYLISVSSIVGAMCSLLNQPFFNYLRSCRRHEVPTLRVVLPSTVDPAMNCVYTRPPSSDQKHAIPGIDYCVESGPPVVFDGGTESCEVILASTYNILTDRAHSKADGYV